MRRTSPAVAPGSRGRHACLVSLCLLAATPSPGLQQAPPPDPFSRVSFLLGAWEGTSEGQPGKGTLRREYTKTLRDRFIHVRNRSEYPPQEQNPKGEVHEDEGFISYDRARQRLVLRQFHVEGFVSQYVEEPDQASSRLVFTSEAIENIPSGWRARETYLVLGPDEFEEIFELAKPGGAFEVYSRARLKRVEVGR